MQGGGAGGQEGGGGVGDQGIILYFSPCMEFL